MALLSRPWLLWLVIAALLGWVVATRWQVSTAITHFLPDSRSGEREAAEIAQRLVASELGRVLVLSLGGADAGARVEASRGLAADLLRSGLFESVRTGLDDSVQQAAHALYFPRRQYLLGADPERDVPARFEPAALERSASDLRRRLGSAMGPLYAQLAADDPLLTFTSRLERLQALQAGGLQVRDGVFVDPSGEHVLTFATSRAAALDTQAQAAVMAAIDTGFARQQRELGSGLRLEMAGVAPFALESEHLIRADVTRVSLFSAIGLLVLFLGVFPGVRYLVLAWVPLGLGMLAAMAAGLLVFGQLHGITLAFGGVLIGVGVDYPVHLFNHHCMAPPGHAPAESLRALHRPLWLGAITTVAGLAGLAWTAFPGFREIALFTSVGVLVTLLATTTLLPPLMPASGRATRVQSWSVRRLAQLLGALMQRRGLARGLLCAVLLLSLAGWPRLRFESSLAALAPGSPALRAEDRRVREQLGGMDSGRLVVSTGDDLEAALQANDGVAAALDAAVVAGELGRFQSLSAWLPSRALQERSLVALRAVPDAKGRLLTALENAGFEPGAFAHSAFFESPSLPPLQLSDLRGSPLNEVVRPFLADLRGRPAIVTHLRDVRDPEALRRRLQPLAASVYLDQQAMLTALYAEFRQRTLELIGVGLLAVLAIVWLRYRTLRATLSAMLPALLSGACALSLLALAQVPLNLLHLLGLLLTLGVGVDYGIFLLEAGSGSRQWVSTLVGIVVACLSTALSFGLLASSGVPALRALGQVVAIGVPLSLLLAPVARVALMPPEAVDG